MLMMEDGHVGTTTTVRPWTDRMTGRRMLAACARVFAALAESAKPRAPLYVRLAEGIAADHELAGLLLLAPPTQRQPVLLLACVHIPPARRSRPRAGPVLPEPHGAP